MPQISTMEMDNVIHNIFQTACFGIVFIVTVCFTIRYYLSVLDGKRNDCNDSPNSSKRHVAHLGYSLNINEMAFISSWKVDEIKNKKEIAVLNLSLISVMFNYVSMLVITISKFVDPNIYNGKTGVWTKYNYGGQRLGIVICLIAQFIFIFSITKNLILILDNSIYQLSNKWIKMMKIINIAGVVSIFLVSIYFRMEEYIGTVGAVLLCLPIFIVEIIFISMTIGLYYVKLGQIINDLRQLSNHNQRKDDNYVKYVSQMAEKKLLDKLVQSVVVNSLFAIVIIVEEVTVLYLNLKGYQVPLRVKYGITVFSITMVMFSAINTIQAGFNRRLYQKYCKYCHACCLGCIRTLLS